MLIRGETVVKIQPVPLEFVVQTWPYVEGFLHAGLTEEDDTPEDMVSYNIDHVRGFVTSGNWQLLVATDKDNKIVGAATVAYANYPLHRAALVTLVGGKFISSKDVFRQLSDILRANGATKIQGFGRPSIVRLWRRLGFEPRVTLVEVKI